MKTEDAILDAAGRHFAEYGYNGTSIRAILRDANVNAAAAHYHFGSKEILYRAVIEHYLVPLSEQRQQQFDSLDLSDPDPRRNLELLVDAYVRPHLLLCSDPNAESYLKIMWRFGVEVWPLAQIVHAEVIHPVRKQYLKAVRKQLPSLDLDTTRRLFGWTTSIMVGSPFELAYESMAGKSAMPNDVNELVNRVVAMCSGGIVAVAHQMDEKAGDRSRD
tara:strand:+ start:5455 stop:6108 length:654 start_codon:yes stop_codon:yes gene_type:complete